VGLRETWDRLGLVLAISLTWTLLIFVPLTVGRLLPASWPFILRLGLVALTALLTLPAPAAGALGVAHQIYTHDEVSYADLWLSAYRLYRPAVGMGLLQLIVPSLLLVNFAFYLQHGGFAGKIVGLACLYGLLFWSMMAIYHFPILVAQEAGVFDDPDHRPRRGVSAALQRTFYLALGEPLFTLGLLIFCGLLSLSLAFAAVPAACLWLGMMALIITPATRAMLIRYGVLPVPFTEEAAADDQAFRQDR
jgi:hypothetical protein